MLLSMHTVNDTKSQKCCNYMSSQFSQLTTMCEKHEQHQWPTILPTHTSFHSVTTSASVLTFNISAAFLQSTYKALDTRWSFQLVFQQIPATIASFLLVTVALLHPHGNNDDKMKTNNLWENSLQRAAHIHYDGFTKSYFSSKLLGNLLIKRK